MPISTFSFLFHVRSSTSTCWSMSVIEQDISLLSEICHVNCATSSVDVGSVVNFAFANLGRINSVVMGTHITNDVVIFGSCVTLRCGYEYIT